MDSAGVLRKKKKDWIMFSRYIIGQLSIARLQVSVYFSLCMVKSVADLLTNNNFVKISYSNVSCAEAFLKSLIRNPASVSPLCYRVTEKKINNSRHLLFSKFCSHTNVIWLITLPGWFDHVFARMASTNPLNVFLRHFRGGNMNICALWRSQMCKMCHMG